MILRPVRDLAFLPAAKHPSGQRLPAMVAQLRDLGGGLTAVHRTFLTGDGRKAAVDPVRMTLGRVAGAAVRLHDATDRLVIAEGIETALAASILLDRPAWAAVSAGNMGEALALPEVIRDIIIAADNDAPGLRAAAQAAVRWKAEGRAVRIVRPDKQGSDFNDLLRERAAHG